MTNIRTPHTATSTPTPSLRHRPRPVKTNISLYSWQRCFARGVDYAICGLLIIIVLPALMIKPLVLIFFITLLWVILEPICLLMCGTTVGKALFGLRLISYNAKPNYLWRSIVVWVVGLGCGIPVISLLTSLKTAVTLQQKGEAYWDNRFGFQVIAEPVNIMRTILLTLAIVLTFAGAAIWKKASYLQEIQVEHIAATTPPPQTDGCTGNCMNGFGTYVYVDGSKYDGYWRNGEHAIYDPDSEKRLAEQKAIQDALEEQQKVAQAALEAQQKAALDAQRMTTVPQDHLARSRAEAEAQRQAEYDRIRAEITTNNDIIAQDSSNNADRLERIAKEEEEKARQAGQTISDNYAKAAAQKARAIADEQKRLAAIPLTEAQVREAREEHIRELYRTMPVDTFSTYGMAK